MNPQISFCIIFIALVLAVIYCNRKYCMLKDTSIPNFQPYSWSRVQLAWWSIIVLTSFITILIGKGAAPELNQSTVILIGISAATIAAARVIDTSDQSPVTLIAADKKPNFFRDIISDDSGPNIHRFQTVVFNLAFGVYFIWYVLNHINLSSAQICDLYANKPTMTDVFKNCIDQSLNYIMPDIQPNNLILLGLSSATYAALKITENNSTAKNAAVIISSQAVGEQEQDVRNINKF
jgi:hypothetical protein